MRESVHRVLILLLLSCLPSSWTPVSCPEPYSVSVVLGEPAIESWILDLALYDTNGTLGDTRVLVDNVRLLDSLGVVMDPPGQIDFESHRLEGFLATLNPAAVTATVGGWRGAFALGMQEDRTYYVVLTECPFEQRAAELVFEFEFYGPDEEGPLGLDTFVASLYASPDREPLVDGISGHGDILEVTARSTRYVPGVSLGPVDPGPVPAETQLSGIRPNPLRGEAAIVLDVHVAEDVSVDILSVEGRLVRVIKREVLGPGRHALGWNARDNEGRAVPSGVYLLRVRAGAYSDTRPLVLVR